MSRLEAVANTVHSIGLWRRQAVVNNLFHKDCSSFCPTEADESRCQCGLIFNYHSVDAQNNRGSKWTSDTCTVKNKITCYGDIDFNVEDVGVKTSKFVRVANDVDVDHLARFLRTWWRLSEPSLIISMTGGAFDFKMPKDDLEEIKTGIHELATTKNVWTITGGTDSGIMKICGDTVKDHMLSTGSKDNGELIMIGVATWGAIANNQLMVPQSGVTPPLKIRYHTDNSSQIGLNPNHTHFVLIDDGTTGFFGREQEMRALLEKEISKHSVASEVNPEKKGSDQTPRKKIPIVSVMVEGGPGTIDTVRNSLKAGAPCVVIGESGRAASLLEASISLFDEVGKVVSPSLEAEIKSLTETFLGPIGVEKNMTMIKECLEFRSQIRVFQLDPDENNTSSDLDKAVLSTLLNSGSLSFEQQLNFALNWDRPDMLKDIFEANTSHANERKLFENFFFRSMVENRLDFVSFFVEKIDLKKFLTKAVLDELYQTALESYRDSFLLASLEKHKGATVRHFTIDSIVDWLQAQLMFHYYPGFECHEGRPIVLDQIEKAGNFKNGPIESKGDSKVSPVLFKRENVRFRSPERELFVFSLLFLRQDLAMFFLDQMPSKIAASVCAKDFCSSILDTFHIKTHGEEFEAAQKMSQAFQQRAIGLLGVCQATDPLLTEKILESSHACWGQRSLFEIALMTSNIEFISQSGCQTVIHDRWMGEIANQTRFWQLVLCSFCPFFIWILIWFKHELEQIREAKDNSDLTKIRKSESKMPLFRKWKLFYLAPVSTYILRLSSNIVYLCLFSYMVLQKLTSTPSVVEIILIFWTIVLLMELVKTVLAMPGPNIFRKLRSLDRVETWCRFDFAALVPFVGAVIVRFAIPDNEDALEIVHVIYVTTLMCFLLKMIGNLALSDILGPQIEMINKMMYDLIYFFVIIAFVILAYGIAVQALMYPGENDPLFSLTWGILFRPFFEMVGDINTKDIGASSATRCNAATDDLPYPYKVCPEEGWKTRFSLFLKALYILISNVMMLNVLIALFNNRFVEIQEMSQEHWKHARFLLTREYANKAELPPPFSIIQLVYYIVKAIYKRELPQWKFIKRDLEAAEKSQVHKWEDLRSREYLRKTMKEGEETIDNKVSRIEKRLGKLVKITSGRENAVNKLRGVKASSSDVNASKQLTKADEGGVFARKLEREIQDIKQSFAKLESLLLTGNTGNRDSEYRLEQVNMYR